MSPDPRYGEPFFWWGPGWISRPRPRIGDLLRDGTIDSWNGAILWAAIARRMSLAVVAGPSGAGKTTLLTALLEFLPLATRRVYPRGCFETFAFLSDPYVDPEETVLLINEISPHLPVYLWGSAVRRLLDATDRGFMMMATAHAASVPEFVGMLTGSPLRIPAPRVAVFEIVVVLESSATTQSCRRVSGIWWLERTREGVSLAPAPPSLPYDISHEKYHTLDPNPDHWFPVQELESRRAILDDLRDGRIDRIPDLRQFRG